MLDRIASLTLRALDGLPDSRVRDAALVLFRGKKSTRPVRTAREFDVSRLTRSVDPATQPSQAWSYSLDDIYTVRSLQFAGCFSQPAEMNAAMNSDDAIFVAKQGRLAPIESMAVEMRPAGTRAKDGRICSAADLMFGEGAPGLSKPDEKAINRDLADHGVAFGYNTWTVRPDGSRIDCLHRHWPIRDVRWDEQSSRFVTMIQADQEPPPTAAPASRSLGRLITEVPIVHGDGRWVVYQNQAHHSWQHDAALIPGCLVWARHAFGGRDWVNVSQTHGWPKWLGMLSPDAPTSLQRRADPDDENSAMILTEEAQAMLDLMADMAGLQQPYGVLPAGASAEMKVNTSTAWQIFENLMLNAEKAAARIWLGTDGIVRAEGAPGVDLSLLFGVASTIIQGDVNTITRALKTGVLEPWAALNFGTSAQAPTRAYLIPDPDLQRANEQHMANEAAYMVAVEARKAARFDADLEAFNRWSTELAKRLGVAPIVLSEEAATSPADNDTQPVSEVRPAA